MTLFSYAQYVAVASLFALMVLIIALAIKSWLDQLTFASNMMLSTENDRLIREMIAHQSVTDFDAHVQSTPGMRYINLN
jgi:hypothetical protein